MKEKDDNTINHKLILKESGSCGPNVSYTLQLNELVISGFGEMEDFSAAENVPWYLNSTKITSIKISDGVIRIGSYSFYTFRSCTSISIPDSVISFGTYSFYDCRSLIFLRK